MLNFASAKNPGGGFLNGAMAQEESLAAASALYLSQMARFEYYDTNRAAKSMVYTDSAIYSPDVLFIRDDTGSFLAEPVCANVLTLPAVNYGEVLSKGENPGKAKTAMRRRMKIALAIFADQGCGTLILGAYGCGVFRNSPDDVAVWWNDLLGEYGGHFGTVLFSVLDRSRDRGTISAFERVFGKAD